MSESFQPECAKPVPLNVVEGIAHVGLRPVKLTTPQKIILDGLLTHRNEPIGWMHFAEEDNGLLPYETSINSAIRRTRDKLNLLEGVVERTLQGKQTRYRLADKVVVTPDATLNDVFAGFGAKPHWTVQAACLDQPAQQFEIEGNTGSFLEDVRAEHCGPCPVRSDCAASGVLDKSEGIVRGGMVDVSELDVLKREYRQFLKQKTTK